MPRIHNRVLAILYTNLASKGKAVRDSVWFRHAATAWNHSLDRPNWNRRYSCKNGQSQERRRQIWRFLAQLRVVSQPTKIPKPAPNPKAAPTDCHGCRLMK